MSAHELIAPKSAMTSQIAWGSAAIVTERRMGSPGHSTRLVSAICGDCETRMRAGPLKEKEDARGQCRTEGQQHHRGAEAVATHISWERPVNWRRVRTGPR
jgi:hypothetical protein